MNFIFKDEKYLFLDSTSNKYNLVRYCFSLYFYSINHYQKIDKYKRKYRGNIFVDKFPRDFTDGNISSVYTDGITVGKKILKQSKKKDDVSFLPTEFSVGNSVGKSVGNSVGKLWTLFIMSITKGITDGIFRRYFPESVIWRFSEKIQLI